VVTKLERTLRREVNIRQRPYIVSLDPHGMKLTLKGRRKGQTLEWEDFVNGDAAFAQALSASLAHANDDGAAALPRKTRRKR
jgi:hypothetical protein